MLDDRCDDSLSFALQYLGASLSIFPLISKSKKPAPGFKWEPFQYTLPDQDQVKSWFTGVDNNIAIATGSISRLLAFDIDGDIAKSHAKDVIQSRIHQDTRDAISDTMWVETGGGGFHLLVRFDPGEFQQDRLAASEIKNAVLWRGKDGHSEVRLKSDGGYIVAPPSVHPNGNAYRLFKGTSIAELSKEQILDLIKAFRQIGGNRNRTTQRESVNQQDDPDGTQHLLLPTATLDDEQIMDIVVILRQYYLKGQRHEFVLFLTGWLRKEGITLESACKVVEELAENDEELHDRLTTLNDTYQKNNYDDIRGFSGLVDLLTAQVGSEQTTRQILKEVQNLLPIQAKSVENNNSNAREERTETSDNNNDSDELTPSRTKKIAKKLIDLVSLNCPLLFVDQYNKPHVWATVVTTSGHSYRDVIPIESRRFETYISGLYYLNSDGEVANKEAVADTVRILAAKALFDNPITKELHLRVAWGAKEKQDEIHYDLTDQMRRCVRITNQGWQIIPHAQDVLFRRFGQLPQVEPSANYPYNVFDQFLDLMHITDPQQSLLSKVVIISYFIPDIAHPIDLTHGEKGSVKTTFCRCIKRLVDPSMPELLTIPSDKREFAQQLYHNYLLLYDNVRSVPDWFSDEVCKAVTGGGISKRQLFTDDEDVVYDYKRCIKINGINIALVEPDALDRSIMSEYKRLPDDKRRSESEVLAEFERMKTQLLGYIMDTLVKALQIKANLNLQRLPRMADFAIWGEAIARALGYKEFEFLIAYNANIGAQNVEAIEASLLGPVVVKFASNLLLRTNSKQQEEKEKDQHRLQDNDQNNGLLLWEGRAEDLLKALEGIAVGPEFAIDIKKARDWPKKSNRLTKMLRPMLSNLREGYGISITIESDTSGKKTGTKNARWIEIRKVSSPSSPSSPEENQAQNDGRVGEDTALDGEDSISTSSKVSSPKQLENDAPNRKSEDGEDSGDTFRLPLESRDSTSCSVPLLEVSDYVAFDLEWTDDCTINNRAIYAAAFVDNHGNSKVLHESDFANSDNPERELLLNINQELSRYDLSIGWYSTGIAKYHEDTQEYLDGVDSDLITLHARCLANGVESIVDFTTAGIPYLKSQKHIDLHSVFGKPMVQTTIFKNAYRTLKLDEVSKAVLSGEQSLEAVSGKYKGLTGKEIQSLTVEEQKKYVLKDAELVMQLSKHNNSEVLDAMKSVAEITGLNFERVCRTGISTWWAAILDNMVQNGECALSRVPLSAGIDGKSSSELQYVGGIVLQPMKGLYHDLIIVDVTSLYPTMSILHNLSFDTINCECCEGDLQSRIPKDTTKDCKIQKEYWVCRQKEGAFPKKLRIFKEERLKQKKLGNHVKQLALKVLINSGYGVFGSQYFKYYDPRVAELITAYGRYTISKMKDIAQKMGFEIVYGDTDSLFLHYRNDKADLYQNIEEVISKLKEECSKQLGIEVEHTKTYNTAIISDKKKHYVGWTGIQGEEPDIVGMEGDKNDRPKWINSVFRQTVYDIVRGINPVMNLKKAISDLESGNVDSELLKRSNRLSKNPEEYENENDRKRKIGLAIGAREGDVIEYFESYNKEGYSLNARDISFRKYKIMLWKTVRDILEISGYDTSTIEHELVLNDIDMATKQSLHVAWLGYSDLQQGGESV
ncbi:MAG TPA: DNA polymerase domain-containing protein [Nitrososphaera sp.]